MDPEWAEIIGFLFSAYATGYGSGLLIKTFKQLSEKI